MSPGFAYTSKKSYEPTIAGMSISRRGRGIRFRKKTAAIIASGVVTSEQKPALAPTIPRLAPKDEIPNQEPNVLRKTNTTAQKAPGALKTKTTIAARKLREPADISVDSVTHRQF